MAANLMFVHSVNTTAPYYGVLTLVNKLLKLNIKPAFFQPVDTNSSENGYKNFVSKNLDTRIPTGKSVPLFDALEYLARGQKDVLLDKILQNNYELAQTADIIIVDIIHFNLSLSGIEQRLFFDIAHTLNAAVIPIFDLHQTEPEKQNSWIKINMGLLKSEELDIHSNIITGLSHSDIRNNVT